MRPYGGVPKRDGCATRHRWEMAKTFFRDSGTRRRSPEIRQGEHKHEDSRSEIS